MRVAALSPETPRAAILGQFASLAAANGASVAALYLNQALVQDMAATFPRDAYLLSLIPMLTLAGYGSGVALIAFVPAANTRISVGQHLALLTVALLVAAAAPNVAALAVAGFFVGLGTSVAQRLIAAAARLGGPDGAGLAIGVVLGAALLAILGVRLGGDSLAAGLGWRAMFGGAALCIAAAAVLGLTTRATREPASSAPVVAGALRALWRGSPLFRWATLQQMALFAAYNAAWMTALVEVPPAERSLVVIGGGGAGLVAALGAGRLVDRLRHLDIPLAGAAFVLFGASILLPAAYAATPGASRVLLLLPGMALLDAGLQFALVANQARVQALIPAARSRLAATLTVTGSFGGSLGAGVGYLLWQKSGWQAAVGFAAVAGLLGLACSLLRTAAQRRQGGPHAAPADRLIAPLAPTGFAMPLTLVPSAALERQHEFRRKPSADAASAPPPPCGHGHGSVPHNAELPRVFSTTGA